MLPGSKNDGAMTFPGNDTPINDKFRSMAAFFKKIE